MALLAALMFVVWSWTVQCTLQEVQNASSVAMPAGQKEVIRLLTLVPYFNSIPALNPSWEGGNDVQPAIDLAVDQINRNPWILANYTLELVHGRDGCGVVTETALGFVEPAFAPGRTGLTGVIGPGCSSSTTVLATVLNASEVSLVSLHGGGSPALSERTQYPLHLGTLGSTVNFVRGFNKLMKKSGWQRMALFYDDSRLYYLSTKQLLVKGLPQSVSLLYTPVSFTFLPLDVIREELLRIVFVMCPLQLTQQIMCLSVNNGLVYPDYQFVIMSHALEDLAQAVNFTYDRVNYNCSKAEMERALEAMFFLNYNLVPEEGMQLESGITYVEYLDLYTDYRELYNQQPGISRNSTYTIWGTYFYDSVWAWALVLDNLTKSSDVNFTIDADYGSVDQSRVLVEQFYRTSFQGMSGEISFRRDTGYSPRKVNISQVGENKQQLVALLSGDGLLSLQGNHSLNFTPDSFRNETLRENRALAVFFTIISAIQISVTVFLHILTVAYRKRPSIKATSPKFLHLSYIGVYILLLGSFLWSLNPAAAIPVDRRPIFCTLLWTWCIPIGFTLAFCPVALRTWRLYRIFKHYLNPGKLISDPILISLVVFVLLVDLLISITWTSVDVFVTRRKVFVMPIEGKANVVGIRVDCYCDYLTVWFGVFFTYKVFILLAVALFAFMTRKIANRSFATTSLRVLVFLLAIVIPLGFSVYLLIIFLGIDGPRNFSTFITLCLLLNGISLLCVLCIFIPPLIPIFRKYKQKIKLASVTSSSKFLVHFEVVN